MNPADVKLGLARRGTHLNPGIEISSAIRKAKTKNINIDQYILDIFSQFNGFQEGALDPGSSIRIWSLEEILRQLQEGQHRSPFADFLLQSNEYTFDLGDANAPIFLDDEKTAVAENFREFLRQIISGYHDF
jgi:hypothetical protein